MCWQLSREREKLGKLLAAGSLCAAECVRQRRRGFKFDSAAFLLSGYSGSHCLRITKETHFLLSSATGMIERCGYTPLISIGEYVLRS